MWKTNSLQEAAPATTANAAATAATRPALTQDLLAGITTGVLAVPQGMAFALIANVPPQHGIYAMIIPTIVAALIRSSPILISGSTNTSALVIGAMLATLPAAQAASVSPVALMVLVTLLMGLMQILAGVLRFGSIGRYVSRAVLLGFTFGAALLIVVGQFKHVLGLRTAGSVLFYEEIGTVVNNLPEASLRALAIAAVTLVIIFAGSRVSRYFPGALVAIAACVVMVKVLGWAEGPDAVAVLGEVPRALPGFEAPPLDISLAIAVMGPSLAIAILGMVEAISIGKALSSKAGTKFRPNQELVGQGAGNIAGAFFGCMPSSASWTRSVLNLQMGAKTRWVGVIAGLTVLVFLLVLAPWAQHVPKAALGAILIWIGAHMIDLSAAKHVWRWSRKDGAVMLVTFAAILVMEIQYAIYFGVIASLILLIHSSAQLHMVEMLASGQSQFREIEINAETGTSPIVLLQLDGDLLFGCVDELESRLEQIAQNGARVIIIRMKRTHGLDATASESLAAFAEKFAAQGGRLILCGLRPEMMNKLSRSHLATVLGPENMLPTADHVYGSVQKAIESAKKDLLAKSPSLDEKTLIRRAPDSLPDAWGFSI